MGSIRVYEDIRDVRNPREGDIALDKATGKIMVWDGSEYWMEIESQSSEEELMFEVEKARIEELPQYERYETWKKYKDGFKRRTEDIRDKIESEMVKYGKWKMPKEHGVLWLNCEPMIEVEVEQGSNVLGRAGEFEIYYD